jgi:hypothetical protein
MGEHLINNQGNRDDAIRHRIWGENDTMFRLFLSHVSGVRKETASLKAELVNYGISCFVAHDNILPTKPWRDELDFSLFTMDALVALITNDFHSSDWTDHEIGVAIGRKVPVIPVALEKQPYGLFERYQSMPGSWHDTPAIALSVTRSLISTDNVAIRNRMVEAYTFTLTKCPNFAFAFNLYNTLTAIEIGSLSEAQTESMIEAYYKNDQIQGCWDFRGVDNRGRVLQDKGFAYELKRITGRDYSERVSFDSILAWQRSQIVMF